jgi:hypothetical protein
MCFVVWRCWTEAAEDEVESRQRYQVADQEVELEVLLGWKILMRGMDWEQQRLK